MAIRAYSTAKEAIAFLKSLGEINQDSVVVCYEKIDDAGKAMWGDHILTRKECLTDHPNDQEVECAETDQSPKYTSDKSRHRTPLGGKALEQAKEALIPLFNKFDGLEVFVSFFDNELGQGESMSLGDHNHKIVTTAKHSSEYLDFDAIITEAHKENSKLRDKLAKTTRCMKKVEEGSAHVPKHREKKEETDGPGSKNDQAELEQLRAIILRYNKKLHCLNSAVERHLPAGKLKELPASTFKRLCIMVGNATGMNPDQFMKAFAYILRPSG